MNPEMNDDWMDEVAGRRLSPHERERRREALAASPAERRRLERELALNDLLDAHRPAPPVSSNFTARVMAEVRREAAAPRRSHGLVDWVRAVLTPRTVAFASLALMMGAGWWGIDSGRQSRLARGATEVVRVSEGVHPSALADFEAVRHLDTRAKADDDALIVALAQ